MAAAIDALTQHKELLGWLGDVVQAVQAGHGVHLRWLPGRLQIHLRPTGRAGHLHPAQRDSEAELLPGPLAPQRRGSGGRPHLHLHQ